MSADSRIVVSGDPVSADLAGELAILSLKSGVYYTLNSTATYIWRQIQEPRTFDQLQSSLVREYDVAADDAAADLTAFVEMLVAEGLAVWTG